jgi:DNA mismatch endonuclease (patch repair protein)
MDIWSKTKRSEVMSKIPTKGTRPEIAFRKALFAYGFRYKVNDKKLPGKPDVVLPKHNTAIFVHGCFWHGHNNCKNARIPKSNVEFWENKIVYNRERDKRNIAKLEQQGWRVLTVWECEVSKRKLEDTVKNIIAILHGEN